MNETGQTHVVKSLSIYLKHVFKSMLSTPRRHSECTLLNNVYVDTNSVICRLYEPIHMLKTMFL